MTIAAGQVLFASDAAASGAAHVTTPVAYDGIVLVSFGGPEGREDVLPYLRRVTRGRGIPDERLAVVGEHYTHFGGTSPINDQNRTLRAALEAELARRGHDLPVFWGNRNWHPFLAESVDEAARAGCRTLLAVTTSAYSSYSSCRQYREDLAEAVTASGHAGEVTIDKVRPYFDHPGFVEPLLAGLRDGLAWVASDAPTLRPRQVQILFTTHSIPTAASDRSGLSSGAYLAQHRFVAEWLAARIAEDPGPGYPVGTHFEWQLVFQSRSGPPHQPWLEPSIDDVIAEIAKQGCRAVVIVPIGFVSDHMEVLWDLDHQAFATAAAHGVAAVRTATPGVHPLFVSGLVDLIEERLEGRDPAVRACVGPGSPQADVCRPGCCLNARHEPRPAAAGLAP